MMVISTLPVRQQGFEAFFPNYEAKKSQFGISAEEDLVDLIPSAGGYKDCSRPSYHVCSTSRSNHQQEMGKRLFTEHEQVFTPEITIITIQYNCAH